MTAGIKEDGYELGVVSGDVNNDGWLDIYVANQSDVFTGSYDASYGCLLKGS